ncbi:S-norcoclaurine synthase 1 [Artemisia annua]|uniref:S-norcoclaurine synthase 1 n=1 Tax=Artemisia annua TaxID=35608 RepID=A0A2U1L0I7_ARTAN|nr:S-norcoclaurine synthase 1 [Artemisia annua]
MFGTLSEETEVKVPASKAWAIYGTLELAKLVVGKVIDAVEVVEGDGGMGTILKITLNPGEDHKVDNENRVKELEGVEGGFLDLGFNFYMIRIEIKDNPTDETRSSCITKLTIEYDVKEEFVTNASLVNTEFLIDIMSIGNEHLLKSS